MADSVSALIESFVPMLGFPPEDDSLLVAVLRCGGLWYVTRGDLEWGSVGVVQMAGMIARAGGDSAVAVIVSANSATRPFDTGEVFAELAGELRRGGVSLTATYVVDRIEVGGRWYAANGEGSGVLGDPGVCAMAPRVVVDGRRTYPGREKMAAVVDLDRARADELLPLVRRVNPAGGCRRAVGAAVRAVRRLAVTGTLSDAELAAVGASLLEARVRDALVSRTAADPDWADAGEELWTLLARVLPAPWRAEALVLAAVAAYLRGDGTLASTAALAALSVDVDHPAARKLDIALHWIGLLPDELRALLLPSWRHRRPGLDRLPAEIPASVRTATG